MGMLEVPQHSNAQAAKVLGYARAARIIVQHQAELPFSVPSSVIWPSAKPISLSPPLSAPDHVTSPASEPGSYFILLTVW